MQSGPGIYCADCEKMFRGGKIPYIGQPIIFKGTFRGKP